MPLSPLTCSNLAASACPLASLAPPPEEVLPEEVRLRTDTEATQGAVTVVVVTPSPVSAQSLFIPFKYTVASLQATSHPMLNSPLLP